MAANQTNLTNSAFNYRRPWYSQVYNAMIDMQHTSPYGHEHTESLLSSRILGQKKYEITNHLGNVLAVVSDKEIDVPVSPVSSALVALQEQKSGLYAAYDYYPFGMLMPDRFVQNNTEQCVWITQNDYVKHYIDNWTLSFDGNDHEQHISAGEVSQFVFTPISPEGEPGNVSVTANEPNLEASVVIDLGAATINKDVQFIFDVVTNGSNSLVLDVVQYNPSIQADEVIGTYEVPADREAHFMIEGTTTTSEPLRAVLRSSGEGENSFLLHSTRYVQIDELVEPKWVQICPVDNFDNDYRFGFNGQEKDNEVKGIGNSLDFGARIYDSRLGRWLSLDPLQAKYPNLSPYNFVGNMPTIAVDPDGRVIKIVSTDPSFRKAAFTALQKLTSHKLLLLNDGRVVEANSVKLAQNISTGLGVELEGTLTGPIGNGPILRPKSKPLGTGLIKNLIDDNHTVSIMETSGGNETSPADQRKSLDALKKGEEIISSNGTKYYGTGKGTDAIILYNPNKKGKTIVNEDGTTGRPSEVGLGHELGHSWNIFKGIVSLIKRKKVTDPDSKSKKKGTLSNEEIGIRKNIDNGIRKEQNVKIRAIPR